MQSSVVIKDGTGLEVLTQLNAAFATLASCNTGASEPTETYPAMHWLDTSGTNAVLKQRNADNTAWIERGSFIDNKFHSADRTQIIVKELTLSTVWEGDSVPFTQEIEVEELSETDAPTITIVPAGTHSEQMAQVAEFSKVYRGVTSEGKITFYAKEATVLPVALQMQLIM